MDVQTFAAQRRFASAHAAFLATILLMRNLMKDNQWFEKRGQRGESADGAAPTEKPQLAKLLEALRDELIGYGDMLLLLDQQQKFILNRRADELLKNAGSISSHIDVLAGARRTRQLLSKSLARAFGARELTTFRQLIELTPMEYQPLLRSLVREINLILFDCQQRLLQNKLLLGPPPSTPKTTADGRPFVTFGLN